MAEAKIFKQINFTMENKTGLAAEICTALVDAKVNIMAICGYEMDKQAEFMLLCDNPTVAKRVLKKLKAQISEDSVIVVDMPNKIGELKKVTSAIAEAGINISYFYGTTGSGKTSSCVIKTADNKKALKFIS